MKKRSSSKKFRIKNKKSLDALHDFKIPKITTKKSLAELFERRSVDNIHFFSKNKGSFSGRSSQNSLKTQQVVDSLSQRLLLHTLQKERSTKRNYLFQSINRLTDEKDIRAKREEDYFKQSQLAAFQKKNSEQISQVTIPKGIQKI